MLSILKYLQCLYDLVSYQFLFFKKLNFIKMFKKYIQLHGIIMYFKMVLYE